MNFTELAETIYKKLGSENAERLLSQNDMMLIISDVFFSSENFVKVGNEYHLSGMDAMYTYILELLLRSNTVILTVSFI